MRRITATLLLVTAMALIATPGCVIEASPDPGFNDEVTCTHFDDFLFYCTDTCSVSWDCEQQYRLLSEWDQSRLDACSDCLVENADLGICADCVVTGVASCQGYMEALIGASCW